MASRFVLARSSSMTVSGLRRVVLASTARRNPVVFSSSSSSSRSSSLSFSSCRWMSSTSSSSSSGAGPNSNCILGDQKIVAPPMVYIAGEEMTHYACNLLREQWIAPYFETTQTWQEFDLSCASRDATNDQVLHDAVQAGKAVGAIFKEPTITPSALQVQEMGLSNPLGSPNGAMRRGWNGITISRDTIHIEGVELGFKNPVFFERHAVGGEYGAGWNDVGQGTLLTTYLPQNGDPIVVDKRDLGDDHNVVVVYHNPYDNVAELAHLFFQRCLNSNITPYIVTKKTVFKWQEGFWQTMKSIFDEHYLPQFLEKGLLDKCGGELQHLISDAATMQLIRWTDGGFGMAAHNYDGDMLTDQIAQIHRSPGFITSNLVGKNDDGTLIKEFEASHGTVSDLWKDHLAGRETSLNPLGLVEALIGAMEHAATLQVERTSGAESEAAMKTKEKVSMFTTKLRTAIHNTFRYGQGTRDMSGPSGFTTEDFIAKVAWRLHRYLAVQDEEVPPPKLHEPDRKFRRNHDVDEEALNSIFAKYDTDKDGVIDFNEFSLMMDKMGLAPKRKKKTSKSSKDKQVFPDSDAPEPDI